MTEAKIMTEKLFYGRGRTPFYSCRADNRFSYCAYVPTTWDGSTDTNFKVIVLVHGTNRTAESYRDHYASFAEEQNCVIVAPLFPGGITAPWELNSYKWLSVNGIRFDEILLSMLDEISEICPIDRSKFLLHGFSGGGHFAHRFFYAQPDRLLGVSIGAPGVVSLLDLERDWWVGVNNFETYFQKSIDLDAMRLVPTQMVVGADDKETWEITVKPESPLYMDGANSAGVTRIDRMESLKASFESHGISVRHDVIPGYAHNGSAMYPAVTDFFATILANLRNENS
ncbi:hypothetical protein BH09CHL1_BH09CHL1_30690 [soil metagenome]